MNKFWKLAGVSAVLVAVIVFAGVATALAQGPNQPGGYTPSGSNQAQNGFGTGMGLMAVNEDTMHAAIAEALHLSIEELEAAIAEGKTSYILAQELGIDFSDVQTATDAVHTAALQQAANEGRITQEQADWIGSRRGGQGNGMNSGLSTSRTVRMGGGPGSSGDCLYQTP